LLARQNLQQGKIFNKAKSSTRQNRQQGEATDLIVPLNPGQGHGAGWQRFPPER
jgi:hypothetical protein